METPHFFRPTFGHRCVHRTDSLSSTTVCAEPPTAPVSGPSTAITATAGKSGDTQSITIKLLPASDTGGTSEWLSLSVAAAAMCGVPFVHACMAVWAAVRPPLCLLHF